MRSDYFVSKAETAWKAVNFTLIDMGYPQRQRAVERSEEAVEFIDTSVAYAM
jgi:hypothetical protein